jgi:hypothetical protein
MTVRCAVLTVLLALSPAGVAGQQQDTARPFVRGGVYDKPYLTTILGRTAVGGYAEAHARWQQVDGLTEEAGFVARRFNLFASTRVTDFVRFAAELEVEEGGEEVKLEFAAIDVIIHPLLTLRGGMLLSPLGRFNLSHDSPLNEFTDRPLPSTEIAGVALSEPGLGLLGALNAGAGRITYELYAVNGFQSGLIENSEAGTRIPLGRGNFEDENRSPAVVARVAWSPGVFLEIGGSVHHGAWNTWQRDGLPVDDRRDLTIVVADADVEWRGFRAAGEFVTARIELPATLGGLFASRQRGGWGEVLHDFGHGWVRTMPASWFSAGLRFEVADFDTGIQGDMVRQAQFGLNFRPSRETVIKASYLRGQSRDRFNNPASHAGLRFSLATYF